MPKVRMVACTISVRSSFCVVAVAVALLHVAAAQDVAKRDSKSLDECKSSLSDLCGTGQTFGYLKEAVLEAITRIKRGEDQSSVRAFLEGNFSLVPDSNWPPDILTEDAKFIVKCCGTCRRWSAKGDRCSQK
jgi:hypothetical protein